MRSRLLAFALFASCAACTTPTTPEPPAANNSGNTTTGGTTTACTATPTTVSPPAVGGTFAAGTTTTFTQGGTYLLPAGALRLTGTGQGRVVLTVTAGSTSSNAPFTLNFTGPGSMLFEPFQVAPQSVTMSLCNPL